MALQSYSSHSHCFDRSELAEFALGKLPTSELKRVAVEVEMCPTCQALLETLDSLEDSVIADLKGNTDPLPPDPQLQVQIQAAEEISRVVWGATGAELPDEPPPARLGQYEILERIGQGGMGTVYKAMHTRLKRPAAIKVLPAGRVQEPQAVTRFQREMEAVGQLDHPNLVRAHDAGEAAGQHFLAMEFLDGIDLARLVRQRGPLAVADACEVVRQAALGLQYAHEHGLVHRDVKPTNIMLTAAGVVKVLDLGLARLSTDMTSADDMTATGQIVGTGDFIAPEQGQDTRQADARSDIYALGCTLYFLLAGRAPFSGPEHGTFFKKVMAHVNEAVPPIQRLRAEIPDGLAAVLDRMLAKEPGKRFQRVADVANALEPYTAGHALQGVLDGRGAVEVRKVALGAKRRRRGVRLAVMLPLAVMVTAVGYLYGDMALMVLRGEGLLVVTGQRDDAQLVAVPVNGPDVKLELDEAGTVRLRAGEYEVQVTGGKTSVVIEPERITIDRGRRTIVTVQRQPGPGVTAGLTATAEAKVGANLPGSPDTSPRTLNLPRLSGGVTHFLSEMQEFDVKAGPWGFGKGTKRAGEKWPIVVQGVTSQHGLGMHPPSHGSSSAKYHLDPKCTTFIAGAVITRNTRGARVDSPLIFVVLGDDKVLWRSQPMQSMEEVQPCKIDVPGISVLELRVECLGSHENAHACWLEPQLLSDTAIPETKVLGSRVGTEFTDDAPRGGLLVGLKMSTGKFGRDFQASAVSSLQGIYRTKDGIVRGETNGPRGTAPTDVFAKEGYAVGALEIHVEAGRIMGIRIVFMQVEGDHLNRKASYLSPPYLSVPDGSPVIGGDGKLIVGIKGSWAKQEMRCIGLIEAMPHH